MVRCWGWSADIVRAAEAVRFEAVGLVVALLSVVVVVVVLSGRGRR